MQSYWPEFIIFASAHTLSMISPGPDFLMVVQSSLRYSRKTALWVSLGICCGEMIHVSYSLLGIGLIISKSIWAFTALKLLGSAYLVYLGIQSLRSKQTNDNSDVYMKKAATDLTPLRAFKRGFFTNALNAKAAFFTISFFTVLISPTTPFVIQSLYGFFIMLSTFIWFALVSIFLTHQSIQGPFLGVKHWIERACGAFLLGLGVKLGLSKFEPLTELDING